MRILDPSILFAVVPTSVAGIVGLLVSTAVIFIAILLSDAIIGHEMEMKQILVMSFLAYFLTPLAQALLARYIPVVGFVLMPLLVWFVLGQIILKKDAVTNMKIAVVAFIIYQILLYTKIVSIIVGLVL